VFGALRVVKAFAQEDREEERFLDRGRQQVNARVRLALVEGGFSLLVGLTTAIGTALVLYIGIRHVDAGTLTLGEMLLVMGYLTQLYEPFKTISRKAASLQSHLASAERAFSLIDEIPDVPEKPDARPLSRAQGSVSFRNVSFSHTPNHPVLRHVSFDIAAGQRVGIAGVTGAGKTSLVNLLCRFYDPSAGSILLDGVDLREYKVADVRSQFAMVLQDPVLFSASIAENIAYGRAGASEKEIVAAAQAAGAHEFIVRLPGGYGAPVGERGMRLSGGERQRISLARAFLKDARILVLDEPTSSVDLGTEAAIVEAMRHLMEGRTTFLIAHRASLIEDCDVVLRLDHGRLVECGTRIPPVKTAVFGLDLSGSSAGLESDA
jgi:ATP-binding cassette subfamily B protein